MPWSAKKIALHLVFWSLYLLSQGLVFMQFYEMEDIRVDGVTGIEVVTHTMFPENFYQALRVELVELPVKIIAVYLNLFWLMPVLLFQKRKVGYVVGLAALLVTVAIIQTLLVKYLLLPLMFPGFKDAGSIITLSRTAQYIAGCSTVVVFTGAIHLVAHYFSEKNKTEELQKHHIASELQQLKAQLNPHFLFNTLNNLYGLAMDKSDKAPGLLLQLSGIMSYILHDAKAPIVPLTKELEMLRNFIELEKLRHGDRAIVSFEVQGDPSNWQLPPLLLLPFVENAFKHGGSNDGFLQVEMHLLLKDDTLVFEVKNNRTARQTVIPPSGIGLENVKRRLELLYPGQHTLHTENINDTFHVELKINK